MSPLRRSHTLPVQKGQSIGSSEPWAGSSSPPNLGLDEPETGLDCEEP